MRTARTWLMVGACLLWVAACGSSSKKATDGGVKGGTGGESGSSTGGSSSSATGGKSSSSTGGSTSSGSAGMSASSSTGGSTSSSATGGSTSGSSTGGSTSSGSGGSGTTSTLPSDGNQLSLCTMAQGECNKGYACYSPSTGLGAASGRGFCSKICTSDSDCMGLAPSSATYVCSTGAGTHVCEIACQNAMDTTTCPSGMTCQQTGFGGPGPGNGTGGSGSGTGGSGSTAPSNYHCKYPFEMSPLWGPCGDGTHECDAMLTCVGTTASPSRTGYCTKDCTMDSDCDKPSSGTATPTCVTVSTGGRGMMATKECALDCGMAADGCPTGEGCVMIMLPGGPAKHCEYN